MDKHATTRKLTVFGLCFVVLLLCAGFIGHRSHPIADYERGWCAHQKCARTKIKPVSLPRDRELSLNLKVVEEVELGAKYNEALTKIDTEIANLLQENKVVTAGYNSCALAQTKWDQWFDRFTRVMELSSSVRSRILLASFDAHKEGKISKEAFEKSLEVIMESSAQQTAMSSEALKAESEIAQKVDKGSQEAGKLEAAKKRLASTNEIESQISAAAETGETKGAEPEPLRRLRKIVDSLTPIEQVLNEISR